MSRTSRGEIHDIGTAILAGIAPSECILLVGPEGHDGPLPLNFHNLLLFVSVRRFEMLCLLEIVFVKP